MAFDKNMTDIVGVYEVVKIPAYIDDEFKAYSRDEVKSDLEKKLAAGEIEEEEMLDEMSSFDSEIEFTADHRVITWIPLPADFSEEEIRAAVEAGEIGEVKNGRFAAEEKEWKSVDGKLYYDTGEYREVLGEVQSSWDELICDDEGLLNFASGLMKLKKKQ